jgi:hypothetical protein
MRQRSEGPPFENDVRRGRAIELGPRHLSWEVHFQTVVTTQELVPPPDKFEETQKILADAVHWIATVSQTARCSWVLYHRLATGAAGLAY